MDIRFETNMAIREAFGEAGIQARAAARLNRGFRMVRSFCISLLVALGYLAPASADLVTMKNGDRVSGSVVKKDGATLVFDSKLFGQIKIPWAEVAAIETSTPVNVTAAEGKTQKATLTTRGDEVQVAAGADVRSMPLNDVPTLRNDAEQAAYERLLKPGWSSLWAGTASIGWAGARGNAKTSSFTTGMNAARITRTDKATVYFHSIRASAFVNQASGLTALAVRGGWAYNRNLRPRLFANIFNDYEYDRFQNLDLRTVLGSGLGYKAYKTDRVTFDLLGGAAWTREAFDPPRPQNALVRNAADGYWGDDFSVKLNSNTSLMQSFRMFHNFRDSDFYRMNFDIGLSTKISKWITWNAQLSDRFLNVPVAGRKKNDLIYSTGFGFSFAR
jgi:putative salt-induced outer membrane protein YdiY